MKFLPTMKMLEVDPQSKQDLATALVDIPFDFALPQDWLNDISDKSKLCYHDILATTVWGYPEGSCFGMPVPLCDDTRREFDRLSQHYHGKSEKVEL